METCHYIPMWTFGEGRSHVDRSFISSRTSSLGMAALRNWTYRQPLLHHTTVSRCDSYPVIEYKHFVVAALDGRQNLLHLIKVPGLDRVSVVEIRQRQRGRVHSNLEAMRI